MPKHRWSILCEHYIIDNNNNVSLMACIDEVAAAGLSPDHVAASVVNWALVSLWVREGEAVEKFEMRLVFKSPRGEALMHSPAQQIEISSPRHRTMAQIAVLPLRGYGTHHIIVEWRRGEGAAWDTADEVPIEVNEVASSALASPVPPAAGAGKSPAGTSPAGK